MAKAAVYVGLASLSLGFLAALKSHRASDDPCACLQWSSVLVSDPAIEGEHAVCGEYAEIYSQAGYRTDLSLQDISNQWKTNFGMMREFCADYIMRLNETFCFTFNDHDIDQGAWCYVSSRCEDLNGGGAISDKITDAGAPVKRNLKAKKCSKGQDAWMSDMSPKEMAAYAEKHVINMGMAFLTNFDKLMPTSEAELWQSIEPHWKAGNVQAMPAKLQKAIAESRPIVLYTGGDFHSHYKVVWGKELYSLDRDDSNCPASHCFTAEGGMSTA